MKFLEGYPDFSAADRRRLAELGVVDAQVTELRLALSTVRMFADPKSYAPRSDIAGVLSDVEGLAEGLVTKLSALVTQPSAAHSAAHVLIEEGYWQEDRLDDSGPTSSHHLIPRLQALREAARSARSGLPKGQTRLRLADPRPIKRIKEALLSGWSKHHGSRVRSTPNNETFEEAIASAKMNPPLPPYPKAFSPSKAPNSEFREIAGICYGTVGGNVDPLRAIENYLKRDREVRKETMAALSRGLDKARQDDTKKRPGTSRKRALPRGKSQQQ